MPQELDEDLTKNLEGPFLKAYEEYGDDIVIDEDSYLYKDELSKRLIDRHVCSICAGIVKLPAVMCLSCSAVICLNPCFSKIKPVASQFKDCPF